VSKSGGSGGEAHRMKVPCGVRTFPALMKALRTDLRLTQGDLAALLGMPGDSGRVQVAQWESGARPFPNERLPKLAACLGYWPTSDPRLRYEVTLAALSLVLLGSNGEQS
jgi:transcriptional regulator with XRE-family HTH domain